jgi:hypothetical protein
MTGILLAIALGILLAALQTGYVSAFPAPIALVQLPLIAIAAEISAFRFPRAFAIAAVSGILVDVVSPSLSAETGILLVTTALLALLFTRVFTNSSLPALLALNTAGFLGLHAAFLLRDMAAATLSGDPIALLLGWDRVWALVPGLVAQLATVLAATALVAGLRRAAGPFIIFR